MPHDVAERRVARDAEDGIAALGGLVEQWLRQVVEHRPDPEAERRHARIRAVGDERAHLVVGAALEPHARGQQHPARRDPARRRLDLDHRRAEHGALVGVVRSRPLLEPQRGLGQQVGEREHAAASYSPGGWRATKPAVLRMLFDQRVPPPDSALVSYRRPSTTMNAWPAFA